MKGGKTGRPAGSPVKFNERDFLAEVGFPGREADRLPQNISMWALKNRESRCRESATYKLTGKGDYGQDAEGAPPPSPRPRRPLETPCGCLASLRTRAPWSWKAAPSFAELLCARARRHLWSKQVRLAIVSVLDCLFFGAKDRGDEHGELVWNRKAVEEGAGSSRETVVGAQCGNFGLCRGVRRSETETSADDIREGPGQDRSGTESTVGSLESEEEKELDVIPERSQPQSFILHGAEQSAIDSSAQKLLEHRT